jgi:hypothetical protein
MISLPASAASVKYRNKWVKDSGKYYYYNDKGKKVSGLQEIDSKYYYFDWKGAQRTGWQKIGNDYYFFSIANGKNGSMVKGTKINGIKIWKSGKAEKTKDNLDKLDILLKANRVAWSITNADMTKVQKLKACFEYVKKTYKYTTWRKFSAVKNWERAYARDMFDKGRGNCFSYAAAFAYLASAVGYTNVNVVSSTGHGWAEIDGKVYDPDWALVSKVDSYFGMSYSLSGVGGRPRYKTARAYVVAI